MSNCNSCGLEQAGDAIYCSSCGISLQPFPITGQLSPPVPRGEVRRVIKRTAIGIGAVIGLLIIVAIVTGFVQLPGKVQAAGEPPTASLVLAETEASPISLDELFRANERRIRNAVDDRAKIIQSINADEDAVGIRSKVAPSGERPLHNLPPKQVKEEPLGF